jgi:CheY-like chemotaxis protein
MSSASFILVVDDHPVNLKLIRVLLQAEGYEVRVAADAAEALRILDSALPRLILMDIQLPDIDGLELTRRLKADPRTSAIPIVAITAYAMKGDEERMLEAGCVSYVAKPIDTRGLCALVAGVLSSEDVDT